MTTLEQELIERITQLDDHQQRLVLAYIDMIDHEDPTERHYTAQDLLRMSPAERDRIARDALERALGGAFED